MKQELLKELKEKFETCKKELGFKATFEELDEIFYIKDSVLDIGFVSESFSRQLCSRIVDSYMNWNNYLHSLIMPNPQSMINMHESKMISEDNMRKDIIKLITQTMAFVSTNTKIGLIKDKKEEADFIDESVKFWNKTFKLKVLKIIEKIVGDWKKDAEKD